MAPEKGLIVSKMAYFCKMAVFDTFLENSQDRGLVLNINYQFPSR